MATPSRPVKRAFRHNSDQILNPLNGPTLPATIQTSLLSVGMRIRKSVPEGYKTKPKQPPPIHHHGSFRVENNLHRDCCPTGLLPYCGILKTGNLEQEQTPQVDDLPPLDFDDDDGGFPSSQESSTSEMSSGDRYAALPLLANCNKRPYDDQEQLSPVHPDPLRSHPFGRIDDTFLMARRPMLQPKTRKARPVTEMVAKNSREVMDLDDFVEADFLRFEHNMDEEI